MKGAPTPRRMPDSTVDLAAEAERLRWVAPNLTVPPVLETGSDEAGARPSSAAINTAASARRSRPNVNWFTVASRTFRELVPCRLNAVHPSPACD